MIARRLTDYSHLPQGAAVLFRLRGKGVSYWLSQALGLFNKKWRQREEKFWHVGWIYKRVPGGYRVMEATMPGGLKARFRSLEFLKTETVCYRWFDRRIPRIKIDQWVIDHRGCKYDVVVYPLTMMQYIALKVIEVFQRLFHIKATISLPRVLNDRYTCWEAYFQFARDMGKAIQEAIHKRASRYPMICDLVDALEGADDLG